MDLSFLKIWHFNYIKKNFKGKDLWRSFRVLQKLNAKYSIFFNTISKQNSIKRPSQQFEFNRPARSWTKGYQKFGNCEVLDKEICSYVLYTIVISIYKVTLKQRFDQCRLIINRSGFYKEKRPHTLCNLN